MFEFLSLIRLLTIISCISMMGASISGFISNSCITEIILSVHTLIIGIMLFYYEFFNKNKIKEWFYNELIFRTTMLTWNNLLILGINNVCLGLGIFNVVIGIVNGIYYILNKHNIDNEYLSIEHAEDSNI